MPQLSRGRRLMGEINVVPYIDVMLVLLIIFMVTAPLLTQGITVELPKANAQPVESSEQEPLILSIDAQGRMYINLGSAPEQPLTSQLVAQRASSALRTAPQRTVLVKADERIAYGRVVAAMVILQQSGASKVGFITETPVEQSVESTRE
jgi:biopolymer transport protein TolR